MMNALILRLNTQVSKYLKFWSEAKSSVEEMSGFDAGAVYTNESLVQRQFEEDNPAIFQIARRKFRDFFKQFNDGNFVYKYR